MKDQRSTRRRLPVFGHAFASSCAVTAVVCGMAMVTGDAIARDHVRPSVSRGAALAAAASGKVVVPTVPRYSMNLGFWNCCADMGMPTITVANQYLKDVGIRLSPTTGTLFPTLTPVIPSMQQKRVDAITMASGAYLGTLSTFGRQTPPALFYSPYLGRVILVAPGSKYKTTAQFMARGMSFAKAAAAAVQQLKGQVMYTDPVIGSQPPYYRVMFGLGGVTPSEVQFRYLQGQNIVALSSTPGRVPFAFPTGAPDLVQMMKDGYKPLLSMSQILKYAPQSSAAKALSQESGDMALYIQRSMWQKTPDEVLRLASAFLRTVSYINSPATAPHAYEVMARAINANQGSKLTASAVQSIYQTVDPLYGLAEQKETFWNPKSPSYVPAGIAAATAALIASHTLPARKYDLSSYLAVARQVFQRLEALQAQAQQLAKRDVRAHGALAKRDLTHGRYYYNIGDYLDSVRFFEAALG